ncbi:MAG: S41 family peptidase, partial [Candidatus Saganbacteria bacterium]|nr:S41 family peptidase [Candidatus Saganbacteria bacterium]
SSLIKGKPGTVVKLGILRGNGKEPKTYEIVRAKITIKAVERKSVAPDIGYIKLVTFEQEKAADEMADAIKQVKKENAKALIIDLRDNGGGLLQAAIDIGSMFIKKGVIVYTVDREGERESISSSGKVLWEGPTVVLVNGSSASASEILAGALRDNKMAILVGTHTFGKACVQNVRMLNDGSAILITAKKYLTPNGDDITEKGIAPDVVLEVPEKEGEEEEAEVVEKPVASDIQLQKAIEIIKGKIGPNK